MTKHIFNCCNGQCQLLHCLPAWQEMLSEINFSLFLPLQNSNVVYLESFCANTVSEDSVPLHRAAFSRNKENLCLFSVGSPAAPVDRYSVLYCTWYNVFALKCTTIFSYTIFDPCYLCFFAFVRALLFRAQTKLKSCLQRIRTGAGCRC